MHCNVADTITDWPRYSGHAISGVSGFGFGGANAHLVLREVLPSDLAEPETEPQPVAEKSTDADADAVYVGGVRMDEYGEFIHDDENEGSEFFGQHAYDTDEREPEMPGLTHEAKRLKEVALQELEAEDAANPPESVVPLAISAFLTSRKKATAAELADWIDSPEGRASSLESIGRFAVAAQPRPVPRGGDGARPRRGGQGHCAHSPTASRPRTCTAPTAPSRTGRYGCWPVSVPNTARWPRACICATTRSRSGSTRSTRWSRTSWDTRSSS